MTEVNKHLFLHDSCTSCNYLQHSFYLLKIPVHTLTPSEGKSLQLNAPHKGIIFLCEHTLSMFNQSPELQNQTFSESQLIVAVQNPTRITPGFPYTAIKTPFSIYELNSALLAAKEQADEYYNFHPKLDTLVGNSKLINKLKLMIIQVAPFNTSVLIQGESGVGKDVVANCIHQLSVRKNKAFVPVNCGAIPSELMESELFGHEKGAFTGAYCRKQGRFEMASHGTLFLDEIGDMPFSMQVKLLRVIQENKIERVGGSTSIDVDVRLIAATNKNIEHEILENRFREDLYYRLNVFPIYVPSLREHPEDLPLLIENHLQKIQSRLQKNISLANDTLELLTHYEWPGNIRELANFLERMVVLYPDQVLTPDLIDEKYKVKIKKSRGRSKQHAFKEGHNLEAVF
ncbi:sigma-54 interaction domain-containing protein [Legionella nagasakiensis]|uniref:sigma-54 interaction domain-containing protein n=1 Tax=Legionella nagasakiensis TaxID=535290 RepID=UPI0010562464|nr:sigma-54 dependent transcriptional regulator [Legionella nagasakiensis]